MLTYFCPSCWGQVDPGRTVCPHCTYDLAAYSEMSYEEKLILALRHPIRENRLVAIQLLGELRSLRAVSRFEEILSGESDLFVIREVLHALAKLDSPRARLTLSDATHHPSRLVRKLAHDLLRSGPESGCPQL